jgi:hypothetical protein
MRNFTLLAAATIGLAAATVAQNCSVPSPARTLSNREEFGASFYYDLANHFFDLDTGPGVTLNSFNTWLYDQGAGNPVVPNQVGATGTVEVYTCPTTRIGNTATAPGSVGSPWTLAGTGTITVVAYPGESTCVFTPPVALPAGQIGVAFRYLPTTTGPNPGPLHCIGLSPNPNTPTSDQFLTFSNDGIQGNPWTGNPVDSPNLRISYTPDPNAAYYTTIGEGCYFRPQAFFENFPASATAPDLANTSQQWINLGTNYIVVPAAVPFVPPTTPSLTATPPPASSSNNWDDALSAPFTLPFTFTAPGGVSTNSITISSNGSIYLDAVTNGAYTPFTGASYGGSSFRDGPPRIAAFFHDLDASSGGSIHYEVDPANQFVRVSWVNVPEWPVPTALNTMQVTLYASGSVDVHLGAIANTGVGNGNNAYYGYTPGLGARLGASVDISAALPLTTGDGAIPPVLGMSARPVIGTTPSIVTTNITNGTIVQALAGGASLQPFPIDLASIGMPGCSLTINPFVFLTNVITPNNTFDNPLSIPNNPALLNSQLVFQAAPLTPGYNPASLLLSNGICVRVGN